MPLLLLFILFPLLELAVLIKVGSAIGVLATLLLIVAGVLFGSLILRLAGLATALRARERLARGELPDREVLEGLFMALGGFLLILPGFISDVIGLLCLLPFTRNLFLGQLRRRIEEQNRRRAAFADQPGANQGPHRPDVIEGEYERRDD